MKKILCIFVWILMCVSCYHSKDIEYFARMVVVNNTGRTIEVFKDDTYFGTFRDQEKFVLFENNDEYQFIDLEELIQEEGDLLGEYVEEISIYDVTDGISPVFLKKWTYGEREQKGKQLYRLADSDTEVKTEDVKGSHFTNGKFYSEGHVYIRFTYTFTINPEDIRL